MQFNLSHSGGFVLIAAGDAPVGVDVEMMRELDWHGLAAISFHPAERAALVGHDAEAARAAFFQLWANKEAFLKATGVGLSDHLTGIAIPLAGGPVAAPAGFAPGSWYATPLAAPAGYKAAVVTQSGHVIVDDRTAAFGSV